jgi:prepilin-type N-terminal cleavage/methylation domain-containing protein
MRALKRYRVEMLERERTACEMQLSGGVATLQRFNASTCGRAFTLVELLLVISIMGIIAALAVPAFKNLGKSNIQASASRQLLDDIGRARQLAVSQHTTVYMIFVKTNFWLGNWDGSTFIPSTPWLNRLSPTQLAALTNLSDKQLTGYTFVSLRSVGDQPGQGHRRYLAPWQTLPEGSFIAQEKFQLPCPNPPYPTSSSLYPPYPVYTANTTYWIYGFNQTNNIPFPTEDSPAPWDAGLKTPAFGIPYIAFNYLGQLTVDGQNMAQLDEYIPLAQGTVSPSIDPNTKAMLLSGTPSITESPAGSSTNSMFRIIHIDRLTGRATLEYQRVQ